MRCLVTGASGHLGSYLTRLLTANSAQVIALVRPDSDLWRLSGIRNKVVVLRASLPDLADVRQTILEAAPEVVFHLAWHGVTGNHRYDQEQIISNVTGTLQLFRIIQAAGCRCWVGVGSQAEYGPCLLPLTEDSPTKPVTTYGVSKLCAGLLTARLAQVSGMRHIWFRLLATYGPKDDVRHLIPSTIQKLLARQRPSLTLGEQRWDYLYVEDAAEAILQAAVTSSVEGVYNLGSGEVHTIRSIVERIRDMIDPALPLGFGEVAYASDQIMHLQADITKLVQAIGWAPTIGIDEGLRKTVEWYSRCNCSQSTIGR